MENTILTIKNTTLYLVFSLLVLLSSCQLKTEKKTELLFNQTHIEDNVHLFNNEQYPAISINMSIKLPIDSLAFSELYQAMAITYFDSLYSESKTRLGNLQELNTAFIYKFRSFEQELSLDSNDIGASFNWEVIIANDVVFHGDNYLSILNEYYEYTGGAHGNTTRNYFTFDLKNNSILTAQDLFKEN
ncbi:MAG: DUF4163 domain-containing protein, partial [Bacteroidales bacterium]|nr:DUF4163 domain-containing protein [Bacteroidales bacterium]